MKVKSIKDLPNNKELWEGNESGTCANVYRRKNNEVTWYTFYLYGKPSKVRTWKADKFNKWCKEVNNLELIED